MIRRNSRCPIALPIAIVVCLFLGMGCNHTESYTRDMTWSSDPNPAGLRRLPEGAIRLTFIQSPEFNAGLQIPGLKEHGTGNEQCRCNLRSSAPIAILL